MDKIRRLKIIKYLSLYGRYHQWKYTKCISNNWKNDKKDIKHAIKFKFTKKEKIRMHKSIDINNIKIIKSTLWLIINKS